MSDFDQDFIDAANTRCPKCNMQYEAVRPGKIQPSCSCEYIDHINQENDEYREECARLRAALQKIASIRMDISAAGQLGMVIGIAEKALGGNTASGPQRSET